MHNKIYITIVVVVYTVVATVFLVFPRSTYSELEKRELAQMPEFSTSKLRDNSYPKELAAWFSDSEPYRDQLMATSMWVRDKLRLSLGDDEAISFHASDSGSDEPAPPPADADAAEIAAYQNRINADANAKIANKGIIVVGKAPVARALMAYGGKKGGEKTAEALNRYHSELGVNVYAMVIPLATEFYLPDKARGASSPQLPTIQNIYAHLAPGVKGVNAYSALASHVGEDIYLRTDHHWAPLGAYYAAEQLAKSAGVPFKPLSSYERKVVHGFVGSMYGYSKDIAIKNSPEDFVYHTPKGLNYVTTYINYKVNGDYRVTSESRPQTGQYFYHYKDGSSGAYCTFMDSDMKITQVKTGSHTGRKLMIIKDSYGNAVPGYMFYSFDEVHVIDFRYFNKNMRKYVRDHGITDICLVVNIYNAYSPRTGQKLLQYLGQGDGTLAAPTPAKPTHEQASKPSAQEHKKSQAAQTRKKPEPESESEQAQANSEPAITEP